MLSNLLLEPVEIKSGIIDTCVFLCRPLSAYDFLSIFLINIELSQLVLRLVINRRSGIRHQVFLKAWHKILLKYHQVLLIFPSVNLEQFTSTHLQQVENYLWQILVEA